MKALSIRQPWAELILRGLRNEHRTTRTRIRGSVYIYACKAPGAAAKEMAEINEEFGTDLDLKTLARGALIGTVEIVDCKELGHADYEWVMNAPMRIEPCLKPTGFHVQGLELDWACVTWDGDFRHTPAGWEHWSFCGDRWNRIRKPERRMYLKNAYRVLLTRARQGMVVVVPEGDPGDPTRDPRFYDSTFRYLADVGFQIL